MADMEMGGALASPIIVVHNGRAYPLAPGTKASSVIMADGQNLQTRLDLEQAAAGGGALFAASEADVLNMDCPAGQLVVDLASHNLYVALPSGGFARYAVGEVVSNG